jgi:plastocyanin
MPRLAAACAALALLAGCGGGDSETSGRSVTVGSARTVTVKADEYSFDPGRIVVDGAGRLTIRLENDGDLAHDLRVDRDGRELGGTPIFEGGTRTGQVRLGTGRYEFLCTVGDHAELGMRGTLVVR